MARRTRSRLRQAFGGVAVLAVLATLTSCEYGEATGVTKVTDVSATLHGAVHSTDPTPKYWWEYDTEPTVVDGNLTFAHKTAVGEVWGGPMLTGSRAVTGLSPDATYHYRFCIQTDSGRGLCGAPDTFTTRPADRDVVEGEVGVWGIGLGGDPAVSVSVRAEPDSSVPIGRIQRLPGSHYHRFPDSGDVTCLRISGNRAAVGFTAEHLDGSDPGPPQVVFIEDNGPTGDRFGHLVVDDTPTDCPDPATAAVTWLVAELGDVTITDHEPLG